MTRTMELPWSHDGIGYLVQVPVSGRLYVPARITMDPYDSSPAEMPDMEVLSVAEEDTGVTRDHLIRIAEADDKLYSLACGGYEDE